MIGIPENSICIGRPSKLTIQTSMSTDGRRIYKVDSCDLRDFRGFLNYVMNSHPIFDIRHVDTFEKRKEE